MIVIQSWIFLLVIGLYDQDRANRSDCNMSYASYRVYRPVICPKTRRGDDVYDDKLKDLR
jgi:hypothetical protein